jgi:NADPH:quinone reductase-like Zn-dependent oxidoreductase
MKAVLCKELGPPEKLVLEEIAPVEPGKGQVVIAVKACGVNFPDTLIIDKNVCWQKEHPAWARPRAPETAP